MNVQIRTAYGEMSFDMSQDKALSLISLAINYAKASESQVTPVPPQIGYAEAKGEEPPKAEEEIPAPPAEKPAPKIRLEALFGKRTGWNTPAIAPEEAPTRDTESGAENEPKSYKGFLYVECEKCGKTKGFCVKHPITSRRCECGHTTELRYLLPAHVRCECESRFTYHTNMRSNVFTIDCLHCGAPVDMELGAKAKAFVTIGRDGRSR